MPEGPEVWILSQAINKYYDEPVSFSHGKHLIYNEEDWSFGLTGTVRITDDDNSLIKIKSGIAYGSVENLFSIEKSEFSIEKLGVNWINSMIPREKFEEEINDWRLSKKALGALILDQSKISGIGVAWGSEILRIANCRPDIKACDQNLDNLPYALVDVREKIMTLYACVLEKSDCKEFINSWFKNLYKERDMNVYKKGTRITACGRNWYI